MTPEQAERLAEILEELQEIAQRAAEIAAAIRERYGDDTAALWPAGAADSKPGDALWGLS